MNRFIEIMEIVGSVIGSLLTIMTFIGIISKKPKEWFRKLIRDESAAGNQDLEAKLTVAKQGLEEKLSDIQAHLKESDATDLVIIRDRITHIYMKYKDAKKIPHYEKENVIYLYEQYKELKGNSYVKQIITEMKTWDEII